MTASSGCSQLQYGGRNSEGYSAAFVDQYHKLNVFPFSGNRFDISIPAGLGRFTYSADGKVLYGILSDTLSPPEMKRIDLDPVEVGPVQGSIGFRMVNSISPDLGSHRLYVSGGYSSGGSPPQCGLFELTLSTGQVRTIAIYPTCDYVSSLVNISASPDGAQIIGYRNHELEIINSESGAVHRPLEKHFERGAWSPDGRWLAVVDADLAYGVRILDATSLKERKVLGELTGPDIAWSPDSRYLLGFKRHDFCGPYAFTFEVADIKSGGTLTIWSSWCRINLATIGWVSRDVHTQ